MANPELKKTFEDLQRELEQEDPRYHREAYAFVREVLAHTIKSLDKPVEGPGRHVSGAELLGGMREYALQEYGPMARTVLAHWGIRSGRDFGAVVFNLVNKGVLGKTDEDRLEDFDHAYDFDDAFARPFRPGGESASPSERP